MATENVEDARFTVPLYTSAEAARYLAVKDTTFRTWVKGYHREFANRPPVDGASLIADLPPELHNGPSIPFIGLAEGMFLAALRKIVLKDGQYVFRQVIDQYLKHITYDDAYARCIQLPGYEVAQINADPAVNFGKPYFTHTGTPLAVVQGQLKAGESVADIAGDFDLPLDEVAEVAQREGLLVA